MPSSPYKADEHERVVLTTTTTTMMMMMMMATVELITSKYCGNDVSMTMSKNTLRQEFISCYLNLLILK